MPGRSELHIVFGASGGLGNAVVRELAGRGKRVRAVNRSGKADLPAGVELVKGDASNPSKTREICRGASVVYNCANAPYTDWPRQFPPILDGIIEGAAVSDAKLVFGDNLYMYGPVSGPMTEDLPDNATGPKGRTRSRMARTLLETHQSGKVRATIGRASDFYGPGCVSAAMGRRVFGPALAGGTAELLGNLDAPHTFSYIGDVAKGLVTLAEHDEALGQIWHLPSAETLTTRQFVTLVFEEAGSIPNLRVAPKFLVTMLGWFNPMMREIKEVLYQFEQPFVVDHSKYAKAFGSQPTPHKEAICQTLDWFRRH